VDAELHQLTVYDRLVMFVVNKAEIVFVPTKFIVQAVIPVAQRLKHLPPLQETWVRSLGVGKIPWRRKWQPTPVLLPGESHGWRSLVGYSPQGRKESDTTERIHSVDISLGRLQEFVIDRRPGVLQFMGSQRVGQD